MTYTIGDVLKCDELNKSDDADRVESALCMINEYEYGESLAAGKLETSARVWR